MALWHHAAAAAPVAPGILPNRKQASAAVLRLLSRARRRNAPLVLLRIWTEGTLPLPPAWLAARAADLRIGDLAWQEPGAQLLLLLEDANSASALVTRWRGLAAPPAPEWQWRSASFPEQGLTMEALLLEVGWRP
ncbi:MAG: hypothetical protein ACRD1Y_06010 [Terriglobales bacterium]